jgi:predicted permease
LGLAAAGAGFVRRTLLPNVAWEGSPLDRRVLLATAACTLLAVVGAGILPFLRSSRVDLARALHGASRRMASYPRRLLATLLVVQTSLATLLLVGAGLFVGSLRRVQTLDMGFAPEHLLRVQVDLEEGGVPPQEIIGFYRTAAERVRALPGVTHAGLAAATPFGVNFAVGVRVPGLDSLPRLAGGGPYIFRLGADAIEALDLRIVRGRGFTPADDRVGAAPVTIVTERMARTLWPQADPLAQCVFVSDVPDVCAPIVGVAADLHRQGLREPPFIALFMPLASTDPNAPPRVLLVRTAGPPERLVETVRRELLALRPNLPYVSITPYETIVAPHARSWRLGAVVFTAFGVLSLIVAAIGVYGVLSFSVTQRLPELGIRTALGATGRNVLTMVVGGGVATAAAGAVVGTALALALSGRIQGLLFDMSARSPLVYLLAGGVIVVLALIASLLPALRAVRADPLTVLRAE